MSYSEDVIRTAHLFQVNSLVPAPSPIPLRSSDARLTGIKSEAFHAVLRLLTNDELDVATTLTDVNNDAVLRWRCFALPNTARVNALLCDKSSAAC